MFLYFLWSRLCIGKMCEISMYLDGNKIGSVKNMVRKWLDKGWILVSFTVDLRYLVR